MFSRAVAGLLVIVMVATTVFFITRVLSDPARGLAGPEATEAQYQAVRAQLGLDKPTLVQFFEYIRNLANLNFGDSYWQHESVSVLIRNALPNTIILVIFAALFSFTFGVTLGTAASLWPNSLFDRITSALSIVGVAVPQFWLAAILIEFGAVNLGWLPTSGMSGPSSFVLPAITLGLASMSRIALVVRSTMLDELAQPHILVARAKGFGTGYILLRHALRNVLVPVSAIASIESLRSLAGYSIIVEFVFAWPGIGLLTIQAIQREDLLLVQGAVFVLAIIIVGWNLMTDLMFKVIDPRIDLR